MMDGNGRWARQRGLSRLAGHRYGTQNVRRALDARKNDIITQFLVETIVHSLGGGVIGVAVGVIVPVVVSHFADMKTIVTFWSLALAFGISGLTGIIFGLYPARRAANLSPIEALRHE